MNSTHDAIQEAYGIPPEELIEITTAPYTPAQRTLLVTDILLHRQESARVSNNLDDDEWDDWYQTVTTASDKELDRFWNTVAEWILSRRDIPTEENDAIARQLIRDDTQHEGEAIITHQKFKRFHDDYDADYGFLGYTTYHHETYDSTTTS